MEGFLSEGERPFSDLMCLAATRLLFDSLPKAKVSPEDVGIRTENQLAAWFSFTLPGASAAGLSDTMGKQVAQLAKLAELRSSGALTEEELQAEKARILAS